MTYSKCYEGELVYETSAVTKADTEY